MSKIKFLVMDVDGTLTDGKIYMGQNGEIFKAFDVKDGAGIALLLPKYGIMPVIITARKSKILENRCKELNITEIHQDCFDKLRKLLEITARYGIGLESVAYVGDDLPDIPCMEAVKESGGVVLCPADAIAEIKKISDYISDKNAGTGAIRDCISFLCLKKQVSEKERSIKKVIEFILSGKYEDIPHGSFSDGSEYTIQEYMTREEDDCVIESHRKHIDVQYIIEGHEEFKLYNSTCLSAMGEYNTNIDTEFWRSGITSSQSVLVPGSLIVVYNNQPHKGAILHLRKAKVKKLVCKIEV